MPVSIHWLTKKQKTEDLVNGGWPDIPDLSPSCFGGSPPPRAATVPAARPLQPQLPHPQPLRPERRRQWWWWPHQGQLLERSTATGTCYRKNDGKMMEKCGFWFRPRNSRVTFSASLHLNCMSVAWSYHLVAKMIKDDRSASYRQFGATNVGCQFWGWIRLTLLSWAMPTSGRY